MALSRRRKDWEKGKGKEKTRRYRLRQVKKDEVEGMRERKRRKERNRKRWGCWWRSKFKYIQTKAIKQCSLEVQGWDGVSTGAEVVQQGRRHKCLTGRMGTETYAQCEAVSSKCPMKGADFSCSLPKSKHKQTQRKYLMMSTLTVYYSNNFVIEM